MLLQEGVHRVDPVAAARETPLIAHVLTRAS
jgi:hypothetical protein